MFPPDLISIIPIWIGFGVIRLLIIDPKTRRQRLSNMFTFMVVLACLGYMLMGPFSLIAPIFHYVSKRDQRIKARQRSG
jgi:hypothetical protein